MKELLKARAKLNITLPAMLKVHIDREKDLIMAGADVNTTNSEGTITPLISAVQEENAEYVEELLRAGADVNATDGLDTALMVACKTGNETIVKLLLEAGADVNAENSPGMTALYLAVVRGHAEFRRAQTKKDPDDSLGEINTRFSAQTHMVFLLLKAGAHVHETTSGLNPCTVHLQPPHSNTPNFHILTMLSAAGASIKEKRNSHAGKQF